MSALADAATAAPEGLGAAVGGERAGAQAAIVVVCREPGAREILSREVSKRYGGDYQIVVCARPGELARWMRDLGAAGLPVALVIGGVGGQDADGIEVLAGVRSIDPRALRVAAVGWGDWESVRSVIFDHPYNAESAWSPIAGPRCGREYRSVSSGWSRNAASCGYWSAPRGAARPAGR